MNNVEKILNRQQPSGIVFAPNYWQWFSHHKNHGILPEEIAHCQSQLDMINWLGLDVFSRNIYCKQDEYWFGGICDESFDGVEVIRSVGYEGKDKVIDREYRLSSGVLNEQLRYVFNESTIVQKKFLITDYSGQCELLEKFLLSRKWKFNPSKYEEIQRKVGDRGIAVVGDFFSPLKMLHIVMNPVQTVYFLSDQPELAKTLLDIHEKAQLEVIRECVEGGVKAIMAVDNLDTMFHPPYYVEAWSASFYEKASAICHDHGAKFFIHACGNQKENLALIASLGVDGLEGVAYPPLGNVELDEAMQITPDHFIITGGISAMETRDLRSQVEVYAYIRKLFEKMKSYRQRFMLSASCNTSIDTKWETIKHFRDAWLEYRNI